MDNWLVEALLWLVFAFIAVVICGGWSAVALVLLWQDRIR
jgi:hypothetical protein